MKRTIRHLLAFTALAAIAACAATPPSLVVKDLNNVPGDTPIWMNFVQCWEYILENGGGGREYANAVAISATNYTDKATNALAASTATALGAYLPLSGGPMTGDMIFQPNNSLIWGGDYDNHDAYLMAGSPGLIVYNDANEKWVFKSSVIPETDDDVLRRRDLSAVATAATNYTDESISAANPAFASAVRSVPITGAAESDLAEIAEYGSYGTVGAAILALIAGLAALKRGKFDAVGDARSVTAEDASGTETYAFVGSGEVGNADAVARIKNLPYENMGEAAEMLQGVYGVESRAAQRHTASSGETTATFGFADTPGVGKILDALLYIDNSGNTSALGLQFDGLGMAFALVCPEGDNLAELTSIDAGKLARFYFTETALVSGGLPVIFVKRQTLGAVARTITRS